MNKKLLFLLAIAMFIAVCSCSSEHDIAISSIRLDSSNLTLLKGEQGKLVATIAPENATNPEIIWKSSNPAVATVDMNGNVNALAAGTADVIAGTTDWEISAKCHVSVIVNVSSIELSQSSVTIEKGKSVRLVANITPNDATDKKLNWETSDPNIVEIDGDGNITAINGGNATITVKSADGKKTATCLVTVVVPVQSISLNQKEIILIKGQTAILNVVVSPLDATNKDVLWMTSNNDIVSVDNGEIRALGVGTATITAESLDGNKTTTCLVKVNKSENIEYNPYGEGEIW